MTRLARPFRSQRRDRGLRSRRTCNTTSRLGMPFGVLGGPLARTEAQRLWEPLGPEKPSSARLARSGGQAARLPRLRTRGSGTRQPTPCAPTHTLCANPHPVRQPSTRPSLPNAWNLWPRPLPYAPTFDPAHSLDLRARPSGRQGKPGDWLPDGRRGTRLLRHFEEVALGVAVPADGQTDVALLGVGVSLTAYYDRENLSSETQEDHRIPKIAFAMSTQRRRRERSPSIV
jgi:hypothetical protein